MDRIYGGLVAVYFIVGRWDVTQIRGGESDVPWYAQIRTWVVIFLVLISCAPFGDKNVLLASWRAARSQRAKVSAFALASAAVLVYLMLSAGWASHFPLAVDKAGEMLLMLGVVAASWLVAEKGDPWEVRHGFWLALVAVTALMAILGIMAPTESGRVSVLGGGTNVFGRNMGLLVCGCLYLKQHWRGTTLRLALIGLASVAAMLTVVSGSRGALVATLAGLLLWWVRAGGRGSIGATMLTVLSAVAISVPLLIYTSFGDRVTEVYAARIQVATFENAYLSGRDDLFADAASEGLAHPFFGIGLNAFQASYGLGCYPHNYCIELFAEGGSVGLALGLIPLLLVALSAMRNRSGTDVPTLAAFVVVLMAAQFSGDMYDSRGVFVLGMLTLFPKAAMQGIARQVTVARGHCRARTA